jgi:hypothetical protein
MIQKDQPIKQETNSQPKRPNETGSVSVTGFVKIFDPKTKETFVETRA